jgi:hypothetical protein
LFSIENAVSTRALCHRALLPLLFLIFASPSTLVSQDEARIGVSSVSAGEFAFAINPLIHARYGVAYPLTYMFDLPAGTRSVTVDRRDNSGTSWTPVGERTRADLFNGIDAFRLDSTADRVLVSVAFPESGDSLFIRIQGNSGTPTVATYCGMPRYYDDRRAAVTVTADDWADWFANMYPPLLGLFRSYGLYVTAGAITGGISYSTWLSIQSELDSGFVEVAAHSRTHPPLPYANYRSEVWGCVNDLQTNLSFPALSRRGETGYIYVWIAPNGRYDSVVDSLMSVSDLLVNRLYDMGDTTFSTWEVSRQHFAPINPTIEIGAPSWGGGETRLPVLNARFDSVTAHGGIYHMMWHPQTLAPDVGAAYLKEHLQHISGRNDIWYVNFGHLYLYHMFQTANAEEVTSVPVASTTPAQFELLQNYPNPFNPRTMIRYELPVAGNIKLTIHDLLGREMAVLADQHMEAGMHEIPFDGSQLSSGVYLCRMTTPANSHVVKMILMR